MYRCPGLNLLAKDADEKRTMCGDWVAVEVRCWVTESEMRKESATSELPGACPIESAGWPALEAVLFAPEATFGDVPY